MTKIAICFSGAIRYFYICIPFIKKYLIDSLNADVFLHAWKVNNCDGLDVKFKLKHTLAKNEDVINILKPKKYIIDEYTPEWETKIREESGIDWSTFKSDKDKNYANNACSMYYKIMKCNELKSDYEKENGFTYDIVIRARMDFIFTDYIYLKDILNIKDNELTILNDRFNCMWKSHRYCNDKFFLGKSELMNNMCDLFNKIKGYYKSNKCKIEGQSLFKYHSKNCCKKINKIKDKYTYYKCLNKHISYLSSNKLIRINNINCELLENLSFNFLSNGIGVITDKQINSLKLFQNFIIDKDSKANPDYELELNKDNIINIHNIKHGRNYTFIFDNIYNSTVKINEDIIFYEEIFDFILSVILYSESNEFKCEKSLSVNPKNKNRILYHIPDRGVFPNQIKDIKGEYYIMEKVLYKEQMVPRKAIKIKQIYKRYSKNILPSNYSKKFLIDKYNSMRENISLLNN